MTTATATLFSFRHGAILAGMLASRDISAAELLRAAELPEDALAGGVIVAPLARIETLLELIAQRLEAPLLGLDMAERIPRGAYGITEFVVRSAPTVEHALASMCELAPLINTQLDMRYVADHMGCEVHYTFGALRDALGTHINEFTVAYIAWQFASVIGDVLPLSRAWFAHGRREHARAVAERLKCNVAFQAADCGFAVASDVITRAPA